jgi:hypothetical protein
MKCPEQTACRDRKIQRVLRAGSGRGSEGAGGKAVITTEHEISFER